MKPRAPHTNFTQGTLLRIGLRDGSVIISRFKARRSRFIEVESEDGRIQKIPTKLLKVVSKFDRSQTNKN